LTAPSTSSTPTAPAPGDAEDRTPSRVRVYELAVVLPLLAWLVVGLRQHPAEMTDVLLLEWVVAIAIVDLLPVPTSLGLPFTLSFPLTLSVALIYPPVVGGLIALVGVSDRREFRREIGLTKALWNRSQIAWSVAIESAVFHNMASLRSPWFELLPAVLVCGIVGYIVNTLFVATYIRIKTRRPTETIVRDMHIGIFGEFILSYLGLALFSVVVATTFVRIGPWSIAVFIAPLGFARQMFTRTHSLQEATEALEARRQENEFQALHDALTGLPNRALFQQRLRETIEQASTGDGIVAVLLMDLDRFKEINDTLGHHFGDILLREIGPRLSGTFRDEDLLARLGGDEFGIVLPDLPDERAAIRTAERMVEALESPLDVEGLQLDVSGSIGIAMYPAHSDDVEMLLRRADVAMYAAKESGSGVEVYNPSLDRHSASRLTLLGQVRPAIDEHEFELFYQPKVASVDGKVTGVEALIRWNHPQQGLILPDEFVPMVERTVLLRPLTQYVLTEALRQARVWSRQRMFGDIAINLSPKSLLDQQLPDLVAGLLQEWEIPASALTLELTESFLMADSGRSNGVLARLADVGVSLSIDDFGTGYSSLSHLKRLPISEVKIDRSFVVGMRSNPGDSMIVRATIDLGRNLGVRVVAEGVEDPETHAELVEAGCDTIQGFQIASPMRASRLTQWLRDRGGPEALHAPGPRSALPEREPSRLRAI